MNCPICNNALKELFGIHTCSNTVNGLYHNYSYTSVITAIDFKSEIIDVFVLLINKLSIREKNNNFTIELEDNSIGVFNNLVKVKDPQELKTFINNIYKEIIFSK